MLSRLSAAFFYSLVFFGSLVWYLGLWVHWSLEVDYLQASHPHIQEATYPTTHPVNATGIYLVRLDNAIDDIGGALLGFGIAGTLLWILFHGAMLDAKRKPLPGELFCYYSLALACTWIGFWSPLMVESHVSKDYSSVSFRSVDPGWWKIDLPYTMVRGSKTSPSFSVGLSCPSGQLAGAVIRQGKDWVEGCKEFWDPWRNRAHSACCLTLGTTYQDWPSAQKEGDAFWDRLYEDMVPLLTFYGAILGYTILAAFYYACYCPSPKPYTSKPKKEVEVNPRVSDGP